MEHRISLAYGLTKEEYENFVFKMDFLRKKGFPIDIKSILLAGLNQALNVYFKEFWENGMKVKKSNKRIKKCTVNNSTDHKQTHTSTPQI